jgi:hypothetical protein
LERPGHIWIDDAADRIGGHGGYQPRIVQLAIWREVLSACTGLTSTFCAAARAASGAWEANLASGPSGALPPI